MFCQESSHLDEDRGVIEKRKTPFGGRLQNNLISGTPVIGRLAVELSLPFLTL